MSGWGFGQGKVAGARKLDEGWLGGEWGERAGKGGEGGGGLQSKCGWGRSGHWSGLEPRKSKLGVSLEGLRQRSSLEVEGGHCCRCRSIRNVSPGAGPKLHARLLSEQATQGGPVVHQGVLAVVLRRGTAIQCRDTVSWKGRTSRSPCTLFWRLLRRQSRPQTLRAHGDAQRQGGQLSHSEQCGLDAATSAPAPEFLDMKGLLGAQQVMMREGDDSCHADLLSRFDLNTTQGHRFRAP